jgi:dUTP pyrophosphatase
VDADYRGEVQVLLVNLGREEFTVTRGMRVAQLIVAEVAAAALYETDVVSETIRGAGGFGSTGAGGKAEG